MNNDYNGFKVFSSIEDKFLIENWAALYNRGANYNLSPDWCKIWHKHFGKAKNLSKNLYIITLWKNNELTLLAPLYKKGCRLTLIGTKPDLYDEFNILYKSPEDIDAFIDYLRDNALDVNFKYVNSESEFGKALIRRFCQKGIRQVSHVLETKPVIRKETFAFKRKQKDDNTRCKNNAKKLYGEELVFDFKAEKKPEYIKEFIEFHKARWGGGLLVKRPKIPEFLTELFLNTDFCILSRLYFENSNTTVAYHLGFMDSSGNFWSSMPAYDINYKQISPGKVLLFDLIKTIFEGETEKFDFGRGSEPYKNWFCNYEEILFNITTFQTRRGVMKVRNFINKILR